MTPDFLLYFNKNRQWVEVFLWDVHPNTFKSWKGGRWAYFVATWDNPRCGRFGELHFVKSRLRFDTIAHELDHLRTEWMWVNGETITRKNEERLAEFMDKVVWHFLKELKKIEPEAKLW